MNIDNKNKKGYKKTKLGWIPVEWEVTSLGELGVFSKGIGITKAELVSDGLPCVRYGELYTTHDFIVKEFVSFISVDVANKSKKIKNGDILFAGSGETIEEIGKSAAYLKKEKAYAGGDVIILSTTKNVNAECLSYALETDNVRKQKRRLGQGNSVVHIYPRDLSSIKLPLPPLPEQKAIANLLSTWDEAITKTKALITQKELHKKWLMQNLLTGKKRLQGFSGVWKEYNLGELFSERNEINNNGLPLLSIGRDGVYPQNESVKKDTSNSNKSKYKRILPGDIGYNTMRMWQGRSALSKLEGIVSPAYTVVTPKENANPLFFSYLFKTPRLINLFWRNSQGLVNDTLNCKFKDFKIVKTELPEIEEQTAIAKVLQTADKEIETEKAKLEKLKEQKKGLMQILLTGRIRIC